MNRGDWIELGTLVQDIEPAAQLPAQQVRVRVRLDADDVHLERRHAEHPLGSVQEGRANPAMGDEQQADGHLRQRPSEGLLSRDGGTEPPGTPFTLLQPTRCRRPSNPCPAQSLSIAMVTRSALRVCPARDVPPAPATE